MSSRRAFETVAHGETNTETRMRQRLRDHFFEAKLLRRIVPDLAHLLRGERTAEEQDQDFDEDDASPSGLWDPDSGPVAGGVNHSGEGT